MKVHVYNYDYGYDFSETFVVDDIRAAYNKDRQVLGQRLYCHNSVFGHQNYWVTFKEAYKIHLNPFKQILAKIGLLKIDIKDSTGYYTLHGTVKEFAALDIEVIFVW